MAVPKVTTTGLAWLTVGARALSFGAARCRLPVDVPLNRGGFAVGLRGAVGFLNDEATTVFLGEVDLDTDLEEIGRFLHEGAESAGESLRESSVSPA
jgi:hypothetical protein